MNVMAAANTILAMLGQIAAIIICLFVLIFVLLAVAFNALMAFAMAWVHEKIELIKMLRPTVESINKASKSVSQGVAPTAHENTIVRTMVSLPTTMHAIDKKVEQSTHHIVNAVIEFRARTMQVQTVVKVFLLPGLMRPKPTIPVANGVLEIKDSPSWQAIGSSHLHMQRKQLPTLALFSSI